MEKNFKKDYLFIGLSRNAANDIVVNISSEYSRSARKSQLYVNDEKFGSEVLALWKSINTKKLLSICLFFAAANSDRVTSFLSERKFSALNCINITKYPNNYTLYVI